MTIVRFGIMFDRLPTLASVCQHTETDFSDVAQWRIVCDDPSGLHYGHDLYEAIDEANFKVVLNDLRLTVTDIPTFDSDVDMDEVRAAGACFAHVRFDRNYNPVKVLLIAPEASERIETALDLVARVADYSVLGIVETK